jgi:hypothetical protein
MTTAELIINAYFGFLLLPVTRRMNFFVLTTQTNVIEPTLDIQSW